MRMFVSLLNIYSGAKSYNAKQEIVQRHAGKLFRVSLGAPFIWPCATSKQKA